ncbi:pupal cuticle protein-like [Cimex lectularius]|uniref:CPR type cuticle protein n=1 Tax=Cimex lectularius TaxID=79782 RepID=A0A8I6RQZ3_CIMLE|nr:pupal cuticle protein-like [Cimex lectularius]
MKSFLIILSIIGLAACQHWGGQAGVPQDTPEVAAAKAAHFAALAKAEGQGQQQVPQNQWTQPQQQVPRNQWTQPQQQVPQNQWAPPQQVPVKQWVPQQAPPQAQAQQPWRGDLALPPGFDQNGAPLPVQDTPEVLAERARHFSLYSSGNHISQLAAPAQQNLNSPPAQPQPVYNPAPVQPVWNPAPAQPTYNQVQPQPAWNPAPAQPAWNQAPAQPTYNQAQAQPSWNPAPVHQTFSQQQQPGLPVDTAEVAAAKAAHFAAHAQLGGRKWNQV